MPIPEQERASLETAIRRGFAGLSYPGDDRLPSPDSPGAAMELRRFYSQFAGKNWSQVPSELIEYEYSALSFFGPAAYQFFLPAYLIESISHFEDPNSNVASFTIYDLLPPDESDTDLRCHFKLQKSDLNDWQRRAVLQFLETMRDVDYCATEADDAVERYWNRFRAAS